MPRETEHRYWNDNDSNEKCTSFLRVYFKSEFLNVKKFKIWMERKSRANKVTLQHFKKDLVVLRLTYSKFEYCLKALGYLHNKKFLDSNLKVKFNN